MSQNKYSYTLTTISKVILSPREQGAYYRALNEFDDNDLKTEMTKKATIIYPFYQYGEYEKYQPNNTEYFLPGSSIKGILVGEKKAWNNPQRSSNDLLVDDILVSSENITLSTLIKFQKEQKDTEKGKFKEFFPNLAVEMCQQEIEFEGELFCRQDLESLIKMNQEPTIKMLRKFMEQLEKLMQVAHQEEFVDLRKVYNNLQKQIDKYSGRSDCFLGILGGYKGRTLSYLFPKITGKEDGENEGAIFIDKKTWLPYGLVEISNWRKVNDE